MQVIDNFKHKFNSDGYFKFRSIAIFLVIFLGIVCICLSLSLFSALFGIRIFPAVPGIFLVRAFGFLSLLVPVYFAYAAFILADPRWRPDRIFILNAFLLPFLTLVAGFVFIRDFEIYSMQYSFLHFTGKTGFSLIIISAAVAEVLILQIIKNRFFFNESRIIRRRPRVIHLLPPPEVSHNKDDGTGNTYRQADLSIKSGSDKPVTDFIYNIENSETEGEIETLIDSDIDIITADTEIEAETEVEADNDVVNIEIDDNCEENDAAITEDEAIDIEINDTEIDNEESDTGVAHALEEAEAAAVVHGEKVRKKTSQPYSKIKKYRVPVDILNEYPDGEYWVIDQATRNSAVALKETLEEFKIQAEVTGIRKGPVITMFEILPAPGVKLSRIVGLADNIALRLAASSVRIVAPIPGKHAVGIEVPNAKRNIVSFREIIEGELRSGKQMGIPVVMGKDITGEAQTVDLVQMPHLLIAGATGSGKSVCVNSIILSVLYQLHPAECRLMLIDPKIVELKLYNDIPHLLTPVITEPKKAFQALQYCIYEMERRYACLDSMGVRDIRSYNKRIKEKNVMQEHLPYIVVVIDEFADLMTTTGKELESTVARLAAMSRAVGIHLVLATQRPSIDVITGLIKSNIPSRIAFMVASKIDSRIIIDMVGAEKLLGKGDMLYSGAVDPFPIRMQGAFISEEEVEAVVEHVKSFGAPDYIDDEIFFEDEEDDTNMSLFTDGEDPLYEKALEIVMQQGKASASFVQRRLKIGFNRAARLVEEMERNGVVGPANGSKPRELLRGFNV